MGAFVNSFGLNHRGKVSGQNITDAMLTEDGAFYMTSDDGLFYLKLEPSTPVILEGSPSSLALSSISDTQINLSWTIGSTGHAGHKIYISTDGVNYTLKGTVSGNTSSYAATGLTANTVYYFKVAAYLDAEISAYSNVVSKQTFITVPAASLVDVSWCWFNSPTAVYSESANKTFIGAVHNDGTGDSQNIITIDHSTGVATAKRVGTVNQNDDHNNGSILIKAADNKLFTAYSEHAAGYIRYRTSVNALDASSWGSETAISPLGSGHFYTYPNAFQVSNGDIYIFYRWGNTVDTQGWGYVKSTDGGVTFGAHVSFVTSTYNRIVQDKTNKNILHFLASSHPFYTASSYIQSHYYFNAGDNTWHKSDGSAITASLPFGYTDATPIFSHTDPERGWIEDLFLDSNGYPRALLTFYPTATTNMRKKDLYYTEWNGSAWTTPYKIHQSSNKNLTKDPPPSGYPLQETYMPLACFDRGNPDRIFASKELTDGGKLEIFEIIRQSATSFVSTQKTATTYDQWRPVTTNAPTYNVFWLNKIYYDYYIDYLYEEMINVTM